MNLDGADFDFRVDNTVVNLFRKQPDFDYITYHIGEEYTAVFNGILTRWLGGLALTAETRSELQSAEREHGSYADKYGGNPRIIIDDEPSEYEVDLRVRSLTDDLDSMPDWLGNGES